MPETSALDDVVAALNASPNSALLAGSQIEEDGGWDEIVALAEHISADVYQYPIPPRWTFPRSHPQFRGGLLPAQQPLGVQLAKYDVIVVLGARVFLSYAHVPGHHHQAGDETFPNHHFAA